MGDSFIEILRMKTFLHDSNYLPLLLLLEARIHLCLFSFQVLQMCMILASGGGLSSPLFEDFDVEI